MSWKYLVPRFNSVYTHLCVAGEMCPKIIVVAVVFVVLSIHTCMELKLMTHDN